MDIRPLHTEDDYRAALAEVSALVDQDPKPGTPEGDRLEILSILVDHYEGSMETAHLLRSPANATHLKRSIEQLRSGKASLRQSAAREAAKRLANLGGTQPGIVSASRRRFDAPLEISEATVGRASHDNPELPKEFVVETLQGLAEARAGRTTPLIGTDYNTDFVLWAEDQAAKLRTGKLTELDRDNIAGELESLVRALRRELVERLARLLQNLLQWEYLDGLRLPVWYTAIQEERSMIPQLLEDAPSLGQNFSQAYAQAWDIARQNACDATGLAAVVLPHDCPYSREHTLDVTFWPGRGDDAMGKVDAASEAARRFGFPSGEH